MLHTASLKEWGLFFIPIQAIWWRVKFYPLIFFFIIKKKKHLKRNSSSNSIIPSFIFHSGKKNNEQFVGYYRQTTLTWFWYWLYKGSDKFCTELWQYNSHQIDLPILERLLCYTNWKKNKPKGACNLFWNQTNHIRGRGQRK